MGRHRRSGRRAGKKTNKSRKTLTLEQKQKSRRKREHAKKLRRLKRNLNDRAERERMAAHQQVVVKRQWAEREAERIQRMFTVRTERKRVMILVGWELALTFRPREIPKQGGDHGRSHDDGVPDAWLAAAPAAHEGGRGPQPFRRWP